jgi:hypothetical protein
LSPFPHKNRTTERCSSVGHLSSTVAILIMKPASEHVICI